MTGLGLATSTGSGASNQTIHLDYGTCTPNLDGVVDAWNTDHRSCRVTGSADGVWCESVTSHSCSPC